MQREILFRGKCTETKQWVYGTTYNNDFIISYLEVDKFLDQQDLFQCNCVIRDVIPETIGQFTGLTDKNGVKIFEGDFVRWVNGKFYWEAVISVLKNSKSNTLYAIETHCNLSTSFDEFDEELYTFERVDVRKGFRNEIEFLPIERTEIIGNIHETK